MIRLKIMPLVSDFGEILHHPLGTLNPLTQLVFTRDNRIFEQLSHFPDSTGKESITRPKHIQVAKLPPGLRIVVLHEDSDSEYTRTDELGYEMTLASAKQLKGLVIPNDTSPTNKAIKAYLDQLPDDTFIILGWV